MKTYFNILVLFIFLAACQQSSTSATSTLPPSQAADETATPFFIPTETFTQLPIITQTPLPISMPVLYSDMDETGVWQVFTEGSPTWSLEIVESPSIDGQALRCSITGGEPYSNVHCYKNIASVPDAEKFSLTFSFWFSATTCNNQGSTSTVQALEFTMNKWFQSRRYEFALQWQNVGEGAPQWRYWNPESDNKWVSAIAMPSQCLEAEKWHKFIMNGEIVDNQAHLIDFTIDETVYTLDLLSPSVVAPGEADRLAVAVQIDGNAIQSPYDIFVDDMIFTVQSRIP